MSTPEAVNHPQHYGGDTVYETIKVIRAWGLDFTLGNAIKYISRAGKKPGATALEDLKKAVWYLQNEINALEPPQAQATPLGDPLLLSTGERMADAAPTWDVVITPAQKEILTTDRWAEDSIEIRGPFNGKTVMTFRERSVKAMEDLARKLWQSDSQGLSRSIRALVTRMKKQINESV